MKDVILTPLAQADINDIWDYTLSEWGERQAITYVQSLRDMCQTLSTEFFVSRPADVREGYFKTAVGSHFIYFTQTETTITVVRILHKRMYVERHL